MAQEYLDCISVANMRESDRLTIERFCPGRTLMYRAALGVYRAAEWNGVTVIAVGGGNNGGDGYALACILARNGHPCRLVKLSEKLTEESAYYAKLAAKLGVPMEPYASGAFADCDTVVDCLLGTGFQGSLREPWLSAVEEINGSGARVVSVDINSGMNGDTGEAEAAVRSDLTVTVGFVKRGLVTENAGRYMKRLVVANIGIVLAREEERIWTSGEPEPLPGLLPCPPWLQRKPIDVRSASEQELARDCTQAALWDRQKLTREEQRMKEINGAYTSAIVSMEWNRENLSALFEKYIRKLRITPAWDVKLEFVDDPEWRKTGDFKIDCDDRKAILLLNVANPKQENPEEVIVHELMHIKLYPLDQVTESLIAGSFEEGSPASEFAYRQFFTALEQTVEELAKCFLLEFGENREFSYGRCKNGKSFNDLFDGLKPIV